MTLIWHRKKKINWHEVKKSKRQFYYNLEFYYCLFTQRITLNELEREKKRVLV